MMLICFTLDTKKTEGKIPSVCIIKKQPTLSLTLTFAFDWNACNYIFNPILGHLTAPGLIISIT